MDAQPAHPNRDSLWDSFKGLVELVITDDLPFDFSNKQHYLSTWFVLFLARALSRARSHSFSLTCTMSLSYSCCRSCLTLRSRSPSKPATPVANVTSHISDSVHSYVRHDSLSWMIWWIYTHERMRELSQSAIIGYRSETQHIQNEFK